MTSEARMRRVTRLSWDRKAHVRKIPRFYYSDYRHYIEEIAVRFYKAVTAVASLSADRVCSVGFYNSRTVIFDLQVLNKSGATRTVTFVDYQGGNVVGALTIDDQDIWPDKKGGRGQQDFFFGDWGGTVHGSSGIGLFCYTDDPGGVAVFGKEAHIP